MSKFFKKFFRFSTLLSLSFVTYSCTNITKEPQLVDDKEPKKIEVSSDNEISKDQLNFENIFELPEDQKNIGQLFDNLKNEYETKQKTKFSKMRLYGWTKNKQGRKTDKIHLTMPALGNNKRNSLLKFRKDLDLSNLPWEYNPQGHFVNTSFDETTRVLTIKYVLNNKTYLQKIFIPKAIETNNLENLNIDKNIENADTKQDVIKNENSNIHKDSVAETKKQNSNKFNNNELLNSTKSLTNKPEESLPLLTSVKISTWNIQNFGNKKITKEDFRIQALAEIIALEKLQFISVQEVNYEEFNGVSTLVEVLNEKYNLNFKLAKSPKGLKSKDRLDSHAVWESYGILYNANSFEQLDNSGFEDFEGKNVVFTRPLWMSYWKVKNSTTKFWIINGHLDGPGANRKYNEILSPIIDGYKWSSQGDQEVKEFLDIHNAFEKLKGFYPSKTLEDLVIFNGDTNIKENHFIKSNNYYLSKKYELGYKNSQSKNDIESYKTSFSKKRYVNPYDKFIAFDPNDEFEALDAKDFKFDLKNVFNNKLDYQKYLDLYIKEKSSSQLTKEELALKLSDHTFANALIKVKNP